MWKNIGERQEDIFNYVHRSQEQRYAVLHTVLHTDAHNS